MEAYNSTEHPVLLKSKSSSSNENTINFNFLHDIPDSMKYITEKLIELRTYLNLNKLNKEDVFDHVDGFKKQKKINAKTVKLLFPCAIYLFCFIYCIL